MEGIVIRVHPRNPRLNVSPFPRSTLETADVWQLNRDELTSNDLETDGFQQWGDGSLAAI